MLRLILALLLLLLLGQAGQGYFAFRQAREARRNFNDAAMARHWQTRALRWEARADTLYRQAREADKASARYAELMVRAEGRLSLCNAY